MRTLAFELEEEIMTSFFSARRLAARYTPGLFAMAKLLRLAVDKRSFLHVEGLWRALYLDGPVDQSGRPVPWINTSARRLLEERLSSNLRILEFGAGSSTLFFQERVAHVTSIEDSPHWAEFLRPRLASNVTLFLVNDMNADSYLHPVLSGTVGLFDVIIIDGKFRNRCCQEALNLVSEFGVIVLDDSSRETYKEVFELLGDSGYRALRISGIKPGGLGPDETTLFYRDNNCFNF